MPVPWNCATVPRINTEPPSKDILDHFKLFYDATSFPEATAAFAFVLNSLEIESKEFHKFFPALKCQLQPHLPYKYRQVWDILEKKSKLSVYSNGIASEYNVLVVGAGPCGLRTAIETQFLGAQTVVVEKREDFTRNNVLKLWKFLVEDLKSLGIKSLYGQFATGEVNHIGIKTLQLVLAKVCLLIGVKIACPVTFTEISNPSEDGKRWTGIFSPENHKINQFSFDMIIIASGKNVPRSIHDDFCRTSLGAKMSIAVTANFVNNRTEEENYVEQIAGLSKQYDQQFFANIEKEKGISLENIVYYKGETHYFVMTATRKSLLKRGVLIENKRSRDELLSPNNIDEDNLHQFAIDAAEYSTDNLSHMLPTHEFALNHSGNPDVSVFDFTDLYSASRAGLVKKIGDHKLIMAIVGDSLLQPFWPEGTGCARGFLSAFNTAWMLYRYASGTKSMKLLSERQNLFKLLKQTTDGHGSILKDDYKNYTIDPKTRYKDIPRTMDINKIQQMYKKLADVPLQTNLGEEIEVPQPSRLRPFTNAMNMMKKFRRANHRKRNVKNSKENENLTSTMRTVEIDESVNEIANPDSANDPLKSVDSEIPEENEIDIEKHFSNRISDNEIDSALIILKEYANKNGINIQVLVEFEEMLNNIRKG